MSYVEPVTKLLIDNVGGMSAFSYTSFDVDTGKETITYFWQDSDEGRMGPFMSLHAAMHDYVVQLKIKRNFYREELYKLTRPPEPTRKPNSSVIGVDFALKSRIKGYTGHEST